MVEMFLCDHESSSDSFISADNDLKVLLLDLKAYSPTEKYHTERVNSRNVEWNPLDTKELNGIHLQWHVFPDVRNISNSPCMLPTKNITW